MSERSALEGSATAPGVESPPAGYAGRPRDAQLEYKAILANASIGIAFTRDRKIFLCNPKFAEMLGWKAEELIGQPGETVYPSRQSYEAMGAIAIPLLGSGRQLDIDWEFKRKDGSTFLCHVIAKAISETNTQAGTVWIAEDITERTRADEEIRRLAGEQRLILDNATVGIAFVRGSVIRRCNRFLEEMAGAAPGALIDRSLEPLFARREDWEKAVARAHQGTAPGETHDVEWRFRRADGTTFLCRTRGRRIDEGRHEQEWIWSFEDVTLEREVEERVQRALTEQELILDNATVGIAFARQRIFQRCNPRLEEMFGYGPGEMLGKSTLMLFGSREEFEAAGREMYANLAAGGAYVVERQLRRKDGTAFWCKVVIKAIDPARAEEGVIAIYDDVGAERAARESLEASRDALERAVAERTAELQAEIADRRQAESRARHLADHDALTGLPNRRLLEDRLTQALALSQRNREQTAVMFVDLDRFKAINDSVGHAAGDLMLKEIAERLVKQLRVVDTICRIGGDEFVVVLPEIRRASDVANVARKIIETVSQPIPAAQRELQISTSIGISVFPEDGRDAETLIRNADAAMYHAKESGRANYQFFTEQMNQAASRRLALENDLRQAVLKGEMRVHYQPLVDAATGRVASHEALLRWQHPARGVIAPSEFVQLAEDAGLILRVGDWVLAEACRWANFIGTERGLPVSVNLSARQFGDPKLAERVAGALRESGLPARLLELEIAEPAVMHNADVSLATLRKLKELGVSIAIDGFGAAYSSLVGLRQLPLDKLKIDRSLIAKVQHDGRAIVAGIVGLAHALGLKVVAVGVESEAQRQVLQQMGCDLLQGFLTGAPADADSASKEYV